MNQPHLTALFLHQTKDLYWVVDLDFLLIDANDSYKKFMKAATGKEKNLNESALVDDFGKDDVEKWKAYYKKAFDGDRFEIENHFYNSETTNIEYSRVTFEPLINDNQEIFAVACLSKDITQLVKQKSEATQLIDASLDVFCTFNESGNFVYVSAAAKDHWGYEPEELIGTSYGAYTLEEDLNETKYRAAAIMNGQQTKTFINRYKRKDGNIAYNLWSARWDEHTKLMYCSARDGKEKIQQEEKLLQSERRFKALVQEGSDLIGILDTDGNYSYVSPTSKSVLGIPPEEFIGRNAFEFIHPDDAEKVLASLQKVFTESKIAIKPFRFQNNKNEWRWVETVLTNMLDNPTVNGIVSNSRDITKKIEQEEKIIQTEKRFETLIQNSTDCIIILSPEGETKFVSKAVKNILGYKPAEAKELSVWEQIHPEDIEDSKSALSEAMEKPGASIKGHISRVKHKDGSWRWVKSIVTNLVQDPSIQGIVNVISDVTKQKTEELEKGLINRIKSIFNQEDENSLTNILSDVCDEIVRFSDFSFTEIWLPAFDKKTLNRIAECTGSEAGKAFFKASEIIESLDTKDGLSSLVLKNKETVIWESIDKDWSLLKRKAAANKAGIKSLIAIPLMHNDELLGGLLIGTEKAKSALSVDLDLFQKLELNLGAELSRKKTEIELRQIFSFTPHIICVADFDGFVRRINPAGLELLGYSLEELLSRPIKSFVHKEDQFLTKEKQDKLYRGENIVNFENRYITKEGKVVWLSWTATSITEEGIVYAVAKDITEEKKLRELNRQVGKLVHIGSWDVDLVKQTVFWSDEVHEIYGTDPNSFVPTVDNAIDFYREDFRELAQSSYQECIETGNSYAIEAVVINSRKKEVWVRTTAKAEFINGVCTRVYGSFQDINEKKLANLELERSLKSLQDYKFALDQSAIIAFTDKKGVITSANDNFCEIAGYNRSEIIGNTHRLVNSNHHPAAFFKNLWHTISSGEVWRGEIKNRTKSGSYYWVDTTIVPFLDENNKPTQYLAIRFDITSRKIAEEEKNSFQTTIENSLNEIYMFDVETFKFIYVNEGALKNLGYTTTEVQALTPLDLKPKFDLNSFNQLVAPLKNNEEEKIIFFTDHKRKDGSLYPVEVHLQLVSQGIDKRFLAIILDITERKKAEEIILEANERFERVTEATNDAIWDWDIVNDTFYRSKVIEKFFGKASQKKMNESDFWKDKFHPDDVDKISTSVEEAIADPSCKKWELEYRIFNAQGKMLYVIDRGIIIRDKQGKAIRMVGSMTNISELKKSERENKFKANLLNTIGQAAVATDLKGIVTYWNKAAEQIYGWKKEEAMGKDVSIITPSDANEKQVEKILKMVKDGQMWSGEFEVKKKGGTKFPVRVSNSPVYDNNNEISGVIGISSDITEEVKNKKLLAQYTKELEHSNEELEQFAFIASHDLQEPLRMVSGFMDLLSRNYKGQLDEKAHQYIHFAIDGAKRMKQIIFDLLEYSRSTRHDEQKQEVNLNDLIAEFKQLRRSLISEKSATIESSDLPTLKTFKAAITQIFHCLLDNALKYNKSSSSVLIKIKAKEKKYEWEFSVEDNGIGIDPEFYDKIFIIFQRLHNNDEFSGTGVGLSIAKKHVEHLGGKIWVESALNKGTTFYFTISKNQKA